MTIKLKKFKDLISKNGLFSDGNWIESKDQNPDGSVRLIQLADIGVGKFIDKSNRFMTEERANDLNCTYLVEGDILVARMPDPIGRACIFPQVQQKCVTVVDICIIRPDSDQIGTRWLMHLINSKHFNNQVLQYVTGTTRQRISRGNLAKLDVEVPPLDEQKRIAAILDKADAIRRKRQQAIQLADDFLRSVFLDMFGDPITNPKGFKKAAITEMSEVITGYAFKSAEYVQDSENSVRLCRGANTLTGYFEWKDTAYWDKDKLKGIESYIINSGDVILAMDRPWISSGLKVCIFPENQRTTYLVQRVARIRPKQAIYTDYLYSCILSSAFEKHCCPTETTVPHISPVELKNFEVLVPDKKLVQKYHDVVFKVRSSMLAMEESLLEANSAFNSLSQKAFAGEL
ncbi:restriction endonuclease subunit S [Pseudoalteromonas sp. SIMBA_162]|uniref:restriction endonuclease subunit S n=1 Tax=Pseudoalteromonas sp. SIMBA_162 TaxID=3080867 RepID=UPI00397D2293